MLAVAIVAMAMAMVVTLPSSDPVGGAASPLCGSLSGNVTDAATGEPLQGACVTLDYHGISRINVTGSDGGYRFDDVPLCFCLKDLSASKDGYVGVEMQVAVGEETAQDIALDPVGGGQGPEGGTLTGTVTDAKTGKPIEGATVSLDCHGTVHTVLTDANGTYTFTDVPLCFCLKNLSASKDGYVGAEMQVAVGQETVQDIALEPIDDGSDTEGGTLSGTVTDADTGLPIEGALVSLGYHETLRTALTGADGGYVFTDVQLCRCLKDLSVTKDGYIGQDIPIGVSEVTVQDFALEPVEDDAGHGGGAITGIVRDSSTGKPIESATVTFEHDGTTRIMQTGTDGKYTFMGVLECDCLKRVSVERAGFKGQVKEVGVYGTTVVDFDLEPSGNQGSGGPAVDDRTDQGDGTSGAEMGIDGGIVVVAATGMLGVALITLAVYMSMSRKRGAN